MWRDLIRQVAKDTDQSEAAVKKTTSALISAISDALVEGDRVVIPRLGTLKTTQRNGRVIRGISDGRRQYLQPRRVAVFKVSQTLKRSVSGELTKDPELQAGWRLASTLLSDLEAYFPEKVPELTKGLEASAAEKQCKDSFAGAWNDVWSRWTQATPQRLQDRHLLGEVALQQWAS